MGLIGLGVVTLASMIIVARSAGLVRLTIFGMWAFSAFYYSGLVSHVV